MVPVLEYLYHTMPMSATGLSAHDMSCGHALASTREELLRPFEVPVGLPETDIAAKLFSAFRELYGTFQRVKIEEAANRQAYANTTRHDRVFTPGEIVFRRLPAGARLPKHLFPEPSSGPYEVVSQPTSTSVVLRHWKEGGDGALVDHGARIPLDQILAGPQRRAIAFETEDEVRGVSKMILEEEKKVGQVF